MSARTKKVVILFLMLILAYFLAVLLLLPHHPTLAVNLLWLYFGLGMLYLTTKGYKNCASKILFTAFNLTFLLVTAVGYVFIDKYHNHEIFCPTSVILLLLAWILTAYLYHLADVKIMRRKAEAKVRPIFKISPLF